MTKREKAPFQIKYRPTTLEEIVGNKDTISALESVLNRDDKPHAYLLHGPSGTGKTTIARILKDFFKCGDRDFVEFNTANTRGIDTVRETIAQASYAPISGKSRVFLFDEAHALTSQAMEALLKIVEDCPKHAYFIFSTTNPEKLVSTLRKRCSAYKLSTLTRREIKHLLKWVMKEEGIGEEDISFFAGVLEEISGICDGSPREALVLLDQVIDLTKEEALSHIKNHLITAEASISTLCQQLLGQDDWKSVAETIKALDGDPEQLRRGIIGYLSKVLLNTGDTAVAKMLLYFMNPYFDTGRAGLILSCFTAKKSNS